MDAHDSSRSDPEGTADSKLLILGHSEVLRLLPMARCIDVMAATLAALARGEALLPLRQVMWLPEKKGALATMPAFLGGSGVAGLKVISYFAGNRGTDLDTHQGGVLLFDPHDGRLQAVVDASSITAIRTAAVTAVATRLLARPDATNLAILGSGTQARTHLEAMLLVRPFTQVRVWSRTGENARRFAERESLHHGRAVDAVETARDAVADADVICTTTSAAEPVLLGDWLRPGTHVNAVGSSVPFARELDTAAVLRSRMFVDRLESALNEAGDFLLPKAEGALDAGHIRGEIGDVLLGRVSGRTGPAEVTLFKSLGLAVEDLAAAHEVFAAARAQGLGTAIELGGRRSTAHPVR
jgi:ornithine cyclodeaminase